MLDCSRVLAGPYCAMLLGDLGADVIKIEKPGEGDDTRAFGPPFVGDESPYFWCANRNKRSLTLDLSSADGRAILRRLIQRSQILIENFKVGTLERWGLDETELRQLNPALVHTAITAYGPDGPRAHDPGYDFVLQAESGWMSITGERDGQPSKVGMALVDVLTALYASSATLAALRVAEATGQAQRVDCSLLRSAVAGLINVGTIYLANGTPPQRWGNAHATIVPYQLFTASDRAFVLAVANDRQWQRCCTAIGQPDLAVDSRFARNPARVRHRHELIPLLEAHFATRPAADWLAALAAVQVPSGPINTVPDVFADAQVQQQGLRMTVPHADLGEIALLGLPFDLRDSPANVRLVPPRLGQHTDMILGELGYSAAQIEAWRERGVV